MDITVNTNSVYPAGTTPSNVTSISPAGERLNIAWFPATANALLVHTKILFGALKSVSTSAGALAPNVKGLEPALICAFVACANRPSAVNRPSDSMAKTAAITQERVAEIVPSLFTIKNAVAPSCCLRLIGILVLSVNTR